MGMPTRRLLPMLRRASDGAIARREVVVGGAWVAEGRPTVWSARSRGGETFTPEGRPTVFSPRDRGGETFTPEGRPTTFSPRKGR